MITHTDLWESRVNSPFAHLRDSPNLLNFVFVKYRTATEDPEYSRQVLDGWRLKRRLTGMKYIKQATIIVYRELASRHEIKHF